ncbi:hypothetical protein ACFLSA_06385, partial [Bacteroidota bacterium]
MFRKLYFPLFISCLAFFHPSFAGDIKIVKIIALDTNNSGNINAVEIQFDQGVVDDSVYNVLSDWTFSTDQFVSSDAGATFNTTTQVVSGGTDSDPDDEFVRIGFNSTNVSGTDTLDYNYTISGLDSIRNTIAGSNTLKDTTGTANDNASPVVNSITAQDDTVGASFIGSTFQLDIFFSEEMDQAVDPDVFFPNHDTSTYFNGTDTSGWVSNIKFRVRYNVIDNDDNVTGLDIRITGAQDDSSNTQVQFDSTDLFDVDTDDPGVSTIVAQDDTIGQAIVTAGTFYIDVTFDEDMNQGVTP